MGILDDLSGPEGTPDTVSDRINAAPNAPPAVKPPGGFLDALDHADRGRAAEETPQPSALWDTAKEAGKGLVRGVHGFVGDMGEAVMGPFGPSHHAANLMATLGLGERPPTEPGYGQQLNKAAGVEASPQTTAGKYAGAATEVMGNPASYLGPGGPLIKAGAAAASGLGSEAAGQLTKDTPFETPARIAGGILAPTAVGKVASAVSNTMRARGIPTEVELKAASDNAYKAARALDVEYQTDKVRALQDNIHKSLIKSGFRADTAGGAFSRLKELMEPITPANPGGNRNFSDIEGVRQSLNRLRQETNPNTGGPTANASAASRAISKIDDFLANPKNAAGNDYASQLSAQLTARLAEEARGNWAAMSRSQRIEQALTKSQLNAASGGTGSNIDNAMRQQIKSLLNSPKRIKGFTQDERNMMQDIVMGNPVRNSSRLLGKMAATGIVSAAGVEYLAHALGLGAAGHLLLPAAGYAAKKTGDIMTKNRINGLLRSVRKDSPLGQSRNLSDRSYTAPFALRSLATVPDGQARGGAIGRALRLTKRG